MKNTLHNKKLSESLIINKFLKKLNFNKLGTFNFENDAGFIKFKKDKKVVFTTDSISEDVDFFLKDDPISIAQKIITINLSDLSAMGVDPHSYSLNLLIPKYINEIWIKIFSKELFKLQKKYNFYLLGGDLSKSKHLIISATFIGHSKLNKVISKNSLSENNDIWITGNIGDSYTGLQILKNKLKINNSKLKDYFLNQYYYPKPNMIGSKLAKYVRSMSDISDGFTGDLSKMLNKKYGAKINLKKIPLSKQLKKLILGNKVSMTNILNSGDNFQLIVISNIKFRNQIKKIAKTNNVKITQVGKVIKKLDLVDDSNNPLNITRNFDHFS